MDTDYATLNILTYNVQTLGTESRLLELENALDSVKWDIVGLCEVRRKGEEILERDNNIFYYFGTTGHLYGVGFLVNKKWQSHILEFIAYSERIAVIKLKITEKKILTVIQVYAPTCGHPDDEVEDFYDILNKACDKHRGTWNIVLGDFNAKIGQRQPSDDTKILGPHGLGTRNERGDRLIQFAFGQNLQIVNSFFYKKAARRWTWLSPDGKTKNEIDYILNSDHNMVKNIQTLNNIKHFSDHRPVRVTIKLNAKLIRKKLFTNKIRRLDKETLINNKDTFNLELKNSFTLLNMECTEVQNQCDNITKCIQMASKKIVQTEKKKGKLSVQTRKLIDERQEYVKDRRSVEFKTRDKLVKRSIRKDIRQYNNHLIQTALDKNSSLKTAKRGIYNNKSQIVKIKDTTTGQYYHNQDKILEICTNFYKTLYSDQSYTQQEPLLTEYTCPDSISPITGYETHMALRSMKFNKVPGEDGISTEALKLGEMSLLPHITNLYNLILKTGSFPERFCHSNIILLHKKGEKSDINNYRPISLISHLYKVFIKILENRISGQLDKEQPPEQAGFRRGLSTTDHLHAINQVIEKHREYRLPVYLAFVDYTKAFDSITHKSIFDALANQNIHPTYINLLRRIYYHSTASIKLQSLGQSFNIQKGVKQGDPLSPKLFTSVLEEIFRKLATAWEDKGINVGETKLTNLRFADDIVLFSSSAEELQSMLQDLSTASLEIGLRMNMSKTKLISNSTKRRVIVDGEEMQYVPEYVYLGQIVSFQARQDREVARRTENAWRSYWSMKEFMKGDLPMTLKRKIMDMCILPILTYGAQTWSLTKAQRSKLKVCQRAMERSILGVRLTDHVRNTELRSKTRITDVAITAAKLKWNWAGHVSRMPEELWAKITTKWSPSSARGRGRPPTRWRKELDEFDRHWQNSAHDRKSWKSRGEAFAQQWDSDG